MSSQIAHLTQTDRRVYEVLMKRWIAFTSDECERDLAAAGIERDIYGGMPIDPVMIAFDVDSTAEAVVTSINRLAATTLPIATPEFGPDYYGDFSLLYVMRVIDDDDGRPLLMFLYPNAYMAFMDAQEVVA